MNFKRTIVMGLMLLPAAVFAAEPAAAPPAGAKTPTAQSEAASSKSATPSQSAASGKTAQKPASDARGRGDRLDLDTTTVTGNRELPKVLYIVPWKKADLGDLPAQPFNTLLDEVLTPVDRDVFRREVTYYGAVNSAAAQSAAPASPSTGGTEK
jgi:hypothetical protein